VHCAERIVATSSSHALRWFSAQTALGYAFSSASRIAAIRSGASGFAVLPRFAFAETGSDAAIFRTLSPVGATEMCAEAFASSSATGFAAACFKTREGATFFFTPVPAVALRALSDAELKAAILRSGENQRRTN